MVNMWVTSRYASGFVFEIEVMGSLLALNAVIIGIQVDAWLTAFSTGGPRGSGSIRWSSRMS